MMKRRKNGDDHRNGKPGRDLVVVGTSAGGIEALRILIGSLPRDFPAALMVVLHLSPGAPSLLSKILGRESLLPVLDARDGESIQPGHVYVAQPDLHLMVDNGKVRLVHGPRENRHRPAVDTLFRSAAASFTGRVIEYLTGNLNDGTAGLWAIKRAGGTAIVQDPAGCAVSRDAVQRGKRGARGSCGAAQGDSASAPEGDR